MGVVFGGWAIHAKVLSLVFGDTCLAPNCLGVNAPVNATIFRSVVSAEAFESVYFKFVSGVTNEYIILCQVTLNGSL
jgi:hypothetical protein